MHPYIDDNCLATVTITNVITFYILANNKTVFTFVLSGGRRLMSYGVAAVRIQVRRPKLTR